MKFERLIGLIELSLSDSLLLITAVTLSSTLQRLLSLLVLLFLSFFWDNLFKIHIWFAPHSSKRRGEELITWFYFYSPLKTYPEKPVVMSNFLSGSGQENCRSTTQSGLVFFLFFYLSAISHVKADVFHRLSNGKFLLLLGCGWKRNIFQT